MCVAVSWNVVVGCCRYGVGTPWQPVKLLKHGLVWSRLAGVVELDGWSHWTWRLVRSCRCCPSCRVVVLCQWVTTGSAVQSPLLPFQHGVVLVQHFNAVLFNAHSATVCSHVVTLLSSNVKHQPPYFEISFVYGGESQFWLGTSQFRVASRSMPFQTLCSTTLFS